MRFLLRNLVGQDQIMILRVVQNVSIGLAKKFSPFSILYSIECIYSDRN